MHHILPAFSQYDVTMTILHNTSELHESSQRKRKSKRHLERNVVLKCTSYIRALEHALNSTVGYNVDAAGLEALM